MIDINWYLDVTWDKRKWLFCWTELDVILLKSMPNSCIKQVYVQVFDCESIVLNQM